MVLKKVIYRGHNFFGHKREKVFLCEMSEEEYVDYVRTHKVEIECKEESKEDSSTEVLMETEDK